MGWEWWLAIAGSAASVIGAGLSLWAAVEARRAAHRAASIEREIIFRSLAAEWAQDLGDVAKAYRTASQSEDVDEAEALLGKLNAIIVQINDSGAHRSVRDVATDLIHHLDRPSTQRGDQDEFRMETLRQVARLQQALEGADREFRRGSTR